MNELVSIIVPVYNTEKYLKKCLDSLISQTYENIEIILVDDGSTDSSSEICNEYSKKDPRIRCIMQENAGVSRARNVGISYAKGKYILFVDSDDYVFEDYVKVLHNQIKENDLSVCGYYLVNTSNDVIESSVKGKRRHIKLDAKEYMHSLFVFDEFAYQGYICSKLFLRSIIIQNDIKFSEKIKYNEDRLFQLRYLLFCNDIVYVENPLYMYVQHDENVMSAIKKGYSSNMLTELYAFEEMLRLLNEKNKKIYAEALCSACYAASILNKITNKKEDKKIVKKLILQWTWKAIINRKIKFKNKMIVLYYFLQR